MSSSQKSSGRRNMRDVEMNQRNGGSQESREMNNNSSSNWDWDKISSKVTFKISTCIYAIIILLLVILISLSINYVEWNQIAFKKNTVTNTVDRTEYYKNGRYFWSPSEEPLVFPSVYQNITYRGDDLMVASGGEDENNTASAGLEFGIECNIYYRLNASNLNDIFNDFGTAYHIQFEDTIKASIKNTAPEFTVDDYINNRQQISNRMLEEINNDIGEKLHIQIQPHHFILLDVIFPNRVLKKFEATVAKDLEIDKSILTRAVELYKKGTEELVSEIRAEITILNETTEAKATSIVQTGTAIAEAIKIDAEAKARAIILNSEAESVRINEEALGSGVNRMMKLLNITTTETRIKLFQLFTIMDNPGSEKIIIGDEKTFLNIG